MGKACDHSRMSAPSISRRATCVRCLRPQATCLCALTLPTAHRTEVLVLQHPQEQRQVKNSVALLRLSLAHCEVVVGERFAPGVLEALLLRPGRDTRLLYPDVPAAPAPSAPDPTPTERERASTVTFFGVPTGQRAMGAPHSPRGGCEPVSNDPRCGAR